MANIWDPIITARGGKPIGEGEASTADTTETAEELETRIRAAEQQRQQDIAVACEIAGKPEQAAGFISAGASASNVLAALAGAVTHRSRASARNPSSVIKRGWRRKAGADHAARSRSHGAGRGLDRPR